MTVMYQSQKFTLRVSPTQGVIDISTETGDEAATDLPELVKKGIAKQVKELDTHLRAVHTKSAEEMIAQRGGDPDDE